MDFSFSDDQIQIADSIGGMLADEAAYDRLFPHDFDEAVDSARLLALSAEMGLIGFGAPEAVGGSAAALDDELLVQREAGRYILPLAVPAGAAAATLCAAGGLDDMARSIVAGGTEVGLVVSAQADGTMTVAARGAWALALNGETLALHAVPADAQPRRALDPGAPLRLISAETAPVVTSSDPALAARFQLLLGAYRLGLAEAALQQSSGYAKEREQFGKPIGSFQAVRHRCVDMALRCEGAKAALFFAAICLRDGLSGWALQTWGSAWMADMAAVENARVNIANHGAIGVTCENIGHLLLKRALLCRQVDGSRAAIAHRIAAAASPLIA